MLHIVAKNDSPVQRIAVARRHIETAIAHINDVAQTRVLEARSTSGIDELRLIVRALADIREALRSCEWSAPTQQSPYPSISPPSIYTLPHAQGGRFGSIHPYWPRRLDADRRCR